MNDFDRLPPHSQDAEQAVLGSVLINHAMYVEVAAVIDQRSFYLPQHQAIFNAMAHLAEKQQPIDLLTLPNILRDRGELENVGAEPYLIDLLNVVPTPYRAVDYAHIIKDKAERRQLIKAAGKIGAMAWDTEIEIDQVRAECETALFDASTPFATNEILTPTQAASGWMESFETAINSDSEYSGLSTGFHALDAILRGLDAGENYIVAGRPGMGKSTLALCLALNVAKQGKRVAYFSAEMSREMLLTRAVSVLSQIPFSDLDGGNVTDEQRGRAMDAAGQLSRMPFFIDDMPGMSPSKIQSRALRLHAQFPLDLVVVDHLHRLSADGFTRSKNDEKTEQIMTLTNLYKMLGVPGVTVCQLSRGVEGRAEKRPTLSDLRDSGTLEQEANSVLLLYRDEYYEPDTTAYPNVCDVAIAKNRNGKTGNVPLYFRGETLTMSNPIINDLNAGGVTNVDVEAQI